MFSNYLSRQIKRFFNIRSPSQECMDRGLAEMDLIVNDLRLSTREPCLICGSGYRIGDDGCRHTSKSERGMMPEPKRITLEKYWRKSFPVEGVQVTEENMDAVADWCGGYIRQEKRSPHGPMRNCIKVRVYQPKDERQTMAFAGDRVLYAGTGFKVYTNASFLRSFMPEAEALAHKDPIYRDAVTGHFIPEDEAEEHPDTSVKETSSNHVEFIPPDSETL